MTRVSLVALSLTLVAWPVAARGQEVELYDYVVQPGDTCMGIAGRLLGSPRRYDLIHRHNPNMGPPPHDLAPGTVLRLPRAAPERTGADAELTLVVHRVESRAPAAADWQTARRGLELFRGWRVNTQERSAAELEFLDRSLLQLRANTLVIVFGGSSNTARRATGEARLDSGALRTRLGELRLAVATPSAQGLLQGGSAVLSVDPVGTSRLSNHEGGAARWSAVGARGGVSVAPGNGSKVAAGGRPTAPVALPPPPVWVEAPTALVMGLAGAGATLAGRWAPTPGARATRVEIATTPDGRGVIVATEVPADVDRFEVHGLPDGTYHVRLSTIDGDFFESRPSTPRAVRVVSAPLLPPEGGAAPTGVPDPTEEAAPLRLPAGTVIEAPAGLRCGTSPSPHGPRVLLNTPGRVTISCTGPSGEAVSSSTIEVVGPAQPVTTRPEQASVVAAVVPAAPEPRLETPAARRPARVTEALGLMASPHLLALRAEPDGIGGWLALSASTRASEGRETLRGVAGVQARLPGGLVDLSAEAPVDLSGGAAGSGSGDLRLAVGLGRGRGPLAVRVEAAAWLPTGGDQGLDDARLVPAVEGIWELTPAIALRARQGGLLDTGPDGTRAWASAWGVDLRLAPVLRVGAELDAVVRGVRRGEAGVGVGLGAVLALGPLDVSAGARWTPSDLLADRLGAVAAVLAVRGRWGSAAQASPPDRESR